MVRSNVPPPASGPAAASDITRSTVAPAPTPRGWHALAGRSWILCRGASTTEWIRTMLLALTPGQTYSGSPPVAPCSTFVPHRVGERG
jgi:hypothetical protein